MKQKIVIKVNMSSENSRSKAMALVAKVDGVTSMEIIGDGKDRLEVVGIDVDVVQLVRCLRKKHGYADIVKVEMVVDEEAAETAASSNDPNPVAGWLSPRYRPLLYHPGPEGSPPPPGVPIHPPYAGHRYPVEDTSCSIM